MPRDFINRNSKLGRTGRYSKPVKSVRNAVFNSYDKLKDHEKNKDVELAISNVVGMAAGTGGIPTGASNIKNIRLLNNATLANMRIIAVEPIRFDSVSANGTDGQIAMGGLRYLYKAFGVNLGVSVTHTNENAPPVILQMDFVKLKGSYANSVTSPNAASLYTYDVGFLGDSKIHKILSRTFHISPNKGTRIIKFWKDLNTVMKREVNNTLQTQGGAHADTFDSEDRATERYVLLFKFITNVNNDAGEPGPVLHIAGRCSSRAYEI